MNIETFKASISNGMEFYFKPKYDAENNLYYLVEGYKNKVKQFKIVQKAKDNDGNTWQISHDSIIPDDIKSLELDFVDILMCER